MNNTAPSSSVRPSTPRKRGRPSVRAERANQIVSAFIDLIAANGLDVVTLEQVAVSAGVQRSVIRHNVGNRAQLIAAAYDMLSQRYAAHAIIALGSSPTIEEVVDYLFNDEYLFGSPTEDLAFDSLLVEARRSKDLAAQIHVEYGHMIDAIAATILENGPDLKRADAKARAYQVFCLAESNRSYQRLAPNQDFGKAAAATAKQLMSQT